MDALLSSYHSSFIKCCCLLLEAGHHASCQDLLHGCRTHYTLGHTLLLVILGLLKTTNHGNNFFYT